MVQSQEGCGFDSRAVGMNPAASAWLPSKCCHFLPQSKDTNVHLTSSSKLTIHVNMRLGLLLFFPLWGCDKLGNLSRVSSARHSKTAVIGSCISSAVRRDIVEGRKKKTQPFLKLFQKLSSYVLLLLEHSREINI